MLVDKLSASSSPRSRPGRLSIVYDTLYCACGQAENLIKLPKAQLKSAEFATIRLRLIKVAARVVETASRIRIAFASTCPNAALVRDLALTLRTASA